MTLAVVGFSNGTVNINVVEQNTRDASNNLTAADKWSYPAGPMRAFSGGCSDALLPIGVVVLKGYFGSNDFPSGQALTLYNSAVPGTSCSTRAPVPISYGFIPLDDYAAIYAPQLIGAYGVSIDLLTSGSWTTGNGSSSLQFIRFPAGNYTVVAGDEWGQTVLLHFGVVKVNGGTLVQPNPSSSPMAAASALSTPLSQRLGCLL